MMQNADLMTEKLSGFHLPKAKRERQQLAEERRYVVEDMTRLGEYFAQRRQWLLARDLRVPLTGWRRSSRRHRNWPRRNRFSTTPANEPEPDTIAPCSPRRIS